VNAEADIPVGAAAEERTHRRLEGARFARRSTQFAFLLLMVVILVLGVFGAIAVRRIYTLGNTRYLQEAAPLYASTQDVLVQMLNEETGVRGYVITSNPEQLQPYTEAKTRILAELAAIQRSAAGDPVIARHLAAVRADIAVLQRFYGHQIALVRSGRAGQKQAAENANVEKIRFDHFRGLAFQLEIDAGGVVEKARNEQHQTYVRTAILLGALVVLGLAVAGLLLVRIPSRLYRLYQSETQARRAAEEGAEAARALAHVSEAVVLVDGGDVIRYWNPAAAELFGVESARAVGHPLGSVAPAVLQAIASLGTMPVVLEGRERWLAAAESSFEDGRVIVLRDLTPDHELERMRSEFVATAAHELRTPLAAIYGAVRTIRRTDYALPEPAREEFLGMIESESERLRYLMEQLLASAQLDRASLQLSTGPVELGELCRAVVEGAAVRLPESIRLDVAVPSSLVVVEADGDRLRQAIENLLDNAVKYSPDGGLVEVRVESRDGRGLVLVSDEGIGIPPDQQARIFEKFYRLDPSMTRGVGGSGLGLYIIRELVTLMGGEVGVESALGSGSTFTIDLPLR
jgi:signal transduction histidine kinase